MEITYLVAHLDQGWVIQQDNWDLPLRWIRYLSKKADWQIEPYHFKTYREAMGKLKGLPLKVKKIAGVNNFILFEKSV